MSPCFNSIMLFPFDSSIVSLFLLLGMNSALLTRWHTWKIGMWGEKRHKSKRRIRELDFPPLSQRYDVNLLDNISCLSQPLSHPRLHFYYLHPSNIYLFSRSYEYEWALLRGAILIFHHRWIFHLIIYCDTYYYFQNNRN